MFGMSSNGIKFNPLDCMNVSGLQPITFVTYVKCNLNWWFTRAFWNLCGVFSSTLNPEILTVSSSLSSFLKFDINPLLCKLVPVIHVLEFILMNYQYDKDEYTYSGC